MARNLLREVEGALPSGAAGRGGSGREEWGRFEGEYLEEVDGGGGGRYGDEEESDDEPKVDSGGSDSYWCGREGSRHGYDSDGDFDSDDHNGYGFDDGDDDDEDYAHEYDVDDEDAGFDRISYWTAARNDLLTGSGVQLPKETPPAGADDNADDLAEDANNPSRITPAELDALAVKVFGDEGEALLNKKFLQDTGCWWEWVLKLIVMAEDFETSADASKEMIEQLEAKRKSQEAFIDELRSPGPTRDFQDYHRSSSITALGFRNLDEDETQIEPDRDQPDRGSSAGKEDENDGYSQEQSIEVGRQETLDREAAPSPESSSTKGYPGDEFSALHSTGEEEPSEAKKEALRLRQQLQSIRRDMITVDLWSRFVEATLTRELAVLAQTREIILDDLFCDGTGKGEDEGRLGFVSQQKPYTALLHDHGPSSLWKDVPWMKEWASKDKVTEARETFVQYAMKRWNNGGDIWEIRKKMEDIMAEKGFGV